MIDGRWKSLTHLKLAENHIGDRDISLLIRAYWPLLSHLDLGMHDFMRGNNNISSKGAKELTKAKWDNLL